ncbi:uncharacterized protein GIQ15_06641 [Arthroderma uncinatum]|uniref:uncharacterized protein n=1 Tax=Arthroderma uncinatum TaxID=74035 RepID=UPI00144AA8A0|nr:uncharacterized protein GIQ15_06641 [Arthroderma uncinatum]KAF3479665.1 hypothetical protein GIQ15_06641 [Arthroderma uncinatum]
MKLDAALVTVLSLGTFLVQANPIMPGLPVKGAMKYVGPITPGGANVTLEGTAEHIHAQILKLNPKFNPGDFHDDKSDHELRTRSKTNTICGKIAGGRANIRHIDAGIRYLNSLPGGCYAPAGPRACIRISCSYGSAIYLCNDNNHSISPSCKYLATFAADIGNACRYNRRYINGQEFDSDRYNVILKLYGACR